jgi:glycosyltransferase involved in cell wall biosynthesis
MRVLYLGPGQSPIVRGRVAPFLDEVQALWISSEPFPHTFLARHPNLRAEVLPRPLLRRLPRRLFLHTADYLAETAARVATFRPHLIHVHYLSQLDALALLPVRRTPIVVTVMGADVLEEQVPRPLPLDWAVRRVLRRARVVTAKSRFLAEACCALGARPERVHRLPWGIDTQRFAPQAKAAARAELGLPAEALLLLSSRALQPLYNHHSLVEAAASCSPRPELVFVRHAADEAYAARVLANARTQGLVAHVLPSQSPEGMRSLYAAADACASLPASDGLPQTLLEAMACERPTLSLDLEAYSELPFAHPALVRVAHRAGEPDAEALLAGLQALLTPNPQRAAALAQARAWVAREAEFSDSVSAMRRLYAQFATQ